MRVAFAGLRPLRQVAAQCRATPPVAIASRIPQSICKD